MPQCGKFVSRMRTIWKKWCFKFRVQVCGDFRVSGCNFHIPYILETNFPHLGIVILSFGNSFNIFRIFHSLETTFPQVGIIIVSFWHIFKIFNIFADPPASIFSWIRGLGVCGKMLKMSKMCQKLTITTPKCGKFVSTVRAGPWKPTSGSSKHRTIICLTRIPAVRWSSARSKWAFIRKPTALDDAWRTLFVKQMLESEWRRLCDLDMRKTTKWC